MTEYCHLHVHTEYSLLDGANRVPLLVEAAAKDKQTALAITDHGNMHGALRFYNECKARDVKPVLGCEFYVAMGSRFRKHSRSNGYNHLTLLARNETGYRNLLKLTSLSFIEGKSYKPRIDHSVLARYTEGITCLSGCLSGKVNSFILDGKMPLACDLAAEMKDIFGAEHFWMEIQRNGLNIQDRANEGLIEVAKKIGSPIVATNDIHYLRGEDCDFQDSLLCVNTGARKDDPDRFKFETNHLFVKSQEEMGKMFQDLPQALKETMAVVDQVDINIPQGEHIFPYYDTGGLTASERLSKLAEDGLAQLYPNDDGTAKRRLVHELDVIERMGYPEYFLVVQDFVSEAKKRSIPVGPGRGSAAGSIVSYALGITAVDPLRHNLLFERFLNSDRIGLPDIDIDFCKDRRSEVLDYLKDKHGDERVAQIATFGKFGPKQAVRDSARVLDIPLKETDAIAKKMTGDDVNESIKLDPTLLKDEKNHPGLFTTARKLTGMIKYAGTHACGVIVGDRPLYELVPIGRHEVRGESVIVTQWDLEDCEKVGLVKFDLLGLETLTIIERCQRLIEERHGQRVDLSTIDLDDPKVYAALQQGDSEGVFQCFSDAAKKLLIEMKPDRFDDIIALIALNRPGPLESGIAKQYIDRKHGREKVSYIHKDVEQYLSSTYGCMIYQEQIMQLAQALAGFTLNEADELRKAVGKKLMDMLESIKEKWLNGCKKLEKISSAQAIALWEDILKFGRYGFNLSHSASYAYLTAWTAYLRVHYPVEFFAANMTQEMDDEERLRAFMRDADKHEINILPPDLRQSRWEFIVVNDDTILMGLGAVKGLGESFARSIETIDWPTHDNIIDVLTRIPRASLRKNVVEVLIRSGMLDFSGADRGQMMAKVENILKRVRNTTDRASDGLFEDIIINDAQVKYKKEDSWSKAEKLREERLAFGFYLSGHPMSEHRALVWNSGAKPIKYILSHGNHGKVYRIGGVIAEVSVRAVKNGPNKGKRFARILFEDQNTSIVSMVFTKMYEKWHEVVAEAEEFARPVVITGKLDIENSEEPQIILSSIKAMAPSDRAESFELDVAASPSIDFNRVKTLLEKYPGDKLVKLNIIDKDGNSIPMRLSNAVEVSNDFIDQLEDCIC